MTLEVLSSIKGAEASESVNALFDAIKNSQIISAAGSLSDTSRYTVLLNDLRDDKVIESSELEKRIIKENFPLQENGYLVVSKVIED